MITKYERVLIAIDRSKGANVALERAVSVAKRNKARLDVLQVIDVNSLQYKAGGQVVIKGQTIYDIEQADQKYLLDLQKWLVEEKHLDRSKVFVHLRFGNPRTVIVDDFQPEYHNDLLVIGETGMHLLKRMVAGSVASYVTRAAQCDVLIARNK